MKATFIIIGGGIGGLTTAIALEKQGFRVEIYEAAQELAPVGAGLILAANALTALKYIGIAEEIIKEGHALARFEVLDDKEGLISSRDSLATSQLYGMDNFAIHRADLHQVLLSLIPKDSLFLGKRCTKFSQDETGVSVQFADGTSAKGDYLIAADGISSPVRLQLLPKSQPRYAGYTCWRGVVDARALKIDKCSETWGAKGRFGIVPLTKNRIYWFACINASENSEVYRNFTVNDLYENFKDFHSPIPQILQHTQEADLIWRDIADIAPLTQFAFGKTLLLGDAAHATTPNMGQGACQAIEDVAILAKLLKVNEDIETAFLQFEQKRMPRTTFIVNQSEQIGKIAQISNGFLIKIRNFALRLVPKSIQDKGLDKVLNVSREFGL